MKLFIEIPEEYYNCIKEIPVNTSTADMLIIRNGIPIEECGDCISRKSVSGCVSTMYYKGLGKQKSLEYILKYVDRLPAVTPMPKMGTWERDQFTNQPTCSVCGYKVFGGQTNYCPNCGADMRGVMQNDD